LHFRRDALHLAPSMLAAIRGAIWADAIVSWFGSAHALLPFLIGRLLGRRCVVIAGGYDVAREPAIDYGNMRDGVRKTIGMLVFRLAHRVLPFSESAAREAAAHARVPSAKLKVIRLGVAERRPEATRGATIARAGAVLTVSIVNEGNLSRKGLTTFVQAAGYLPDVPFILAGEWAGDAVRKLRAIAPSNVQFTGWVSDDELTALMEAAAVYVQVSYHEAFGVALAEAMLCGCVPVVTSRGSLPEVVGEAGFYVPYGDPAATADAIRSALSCPEQGEAARARILTCFPPSRRATELLAALEAAVRTDGSLRPRTM
jgi:glycosyltransferase involved in cell wall biosynthesis